jgi:AcrR family transcriptional regulator
MSEVLTPKGAATRRRIIEEAAAEMRDNGVAGTTLDDVRSRARVSKGQLFHYFPDGKEELLLAVARFEAGRVLDDQQPQLGALTSWAAWQEWRDVVVARYRAQGMDCPLSALMSQVGRSTPGARAVVTELMSQWQAQVRAGIEHLQAAGEVGADLDADRTAAAMIASIQGGVGMLMSTGSTEHLEAGIDLVLDHLASSRP